MYPEVFLTETLLHFLEVEAALTEAILRYPGLEPSLTVLFVLRVKSLLEATLSKARLLLISRLKSTLAEAALLSCKLEISLTEFGVSRF